MRPQPPADPAADVPISGPWADAVMDRIYAEGDRYVGYFVLFHFAVGLGLAPFYDSSAGYHYPAPNKAANATVMDQYVTASTGCSFNVPKDPSGNWINNWNMSLDPAGVKLP